MLEVAKVQYKTLRKAFHDPNTDEMALYRSRLESEFAIKIGCNIGEYPAFCVITPELSSTLARTAVLDKEILRLSQQLPGKAIEDYMNACLIDEIVLTNEIENVHSTRREISEVLDNLEKNDRHKRFHGIVAKYNMLLKGEDVPLNTCADIRKLYDDLVLNEIKEADPKRVPDGHYFRTESVSVVDGAEREIHKGVTPESAIIEMMQCMLDFLGKEDVPLLVRVGAAHFLFGYIHPFYDGNGRTNRFISSYMISTEYETLVGLRLSYAIKEEIDQYYKAFTTCEHPLNKGDLTPFVIAFASIVIAGMERLRDALRERDENLRRCEKLARILFGEENEELFRLACVLIVGRLFAVYGATAEEMCRALGVSRQTLYKRIKVLRNSDLVLIEKVARKTYYACNLEELERRTAIETS